LSQIAEFDGESSAQEISNKVDALIDKDKKLQESVQHFINHFRLQNEIDSLKDKIREEDDKIISFIRHLANLEQELHDAAMEEKQVADVDGNTQKQTFTAHEVLVFSERLGQLSAQGYQEVHGYSGYHRPPAPQPKEMQFSKLRMSLDDLIITDFAVPSQTATISTGEEEKKKDVKEESKEGEAEGDMEIEGLDAKLVDKDKEEVDAEEDETGRTTLQDFMLPFLGGGMESSGSDSGGGGSEQDSGDEI